MFVVVCVGLWIRYLVISVRRCFSRRRFNKRRVASEFRGAGRCRNLFFSDCYSLIKIFGECEDSYCEGGGGGGGKLIVVSPSGGDVQSQPHREVLGHSINYYLIVAFFSVIFYF